MENNKTSVIFVVGPPGSGKGTQCQKLHQEFGFLHLSAGDLLRAEAKTGTERGNMVAGILKSGTIVPSHITIELLKNTINSNSHIPVFLIDGFPRNIEQGDAFEKDVVACKYLLSFEAPDNVLIERLLNRAKNSKEIRSDDNEEVIKKRFEVHHNVCDPVVAHYDIQGKLRRVNANRDIEAVYEDIKKLLLSTKN